MRRLLLIGNSHLAAFKLGWDQIADQHGDLECHFFGAPADWIERAVFENGLIKVTVPGLAEKVARVSDGRASVAVAEYDAITFIGMRFGLPPYMSELSRLTTYDLGSLKPKFQVVSKACLRQLFHDILVESPAFRWASLVAKTFPKPIFMIPQPLSSESRLKDDPAIRRHPNYRAQITALYGVYQSATRALAESKGFTLIEQPASTIGSPGFTRSELSRGSVRLLDSSVAHRDAEFNHMNATYGVALLQVLLPAVRAGFNAAPAQPVSERTDQPGADALRA
jgi:hypothetical protein